MVPCSAYFPVLKYAWSERKLAAVKQAKEELFHLAVSATFGASFLQAQYMGMEVKSFAGEEFIGLPIIGLWVGDTPERHLVSLVKGSHDPTSTESSDTWANLDTPFEIRSVQVGMDVYKGALEHYNAGQYREMIDLCNQHGFSCNSLIRRPLRPLLNACFSFRWFSPYSGVPPEEMHDFAGIFLMLLNCFKKLVQHAYSGVQGTRAFQYIDHSYKQMPHFNGLGTFLNGIMHLKTFTALRLRALMMTCVCVFADVFEDDAFTEMFVIFIELFSCWKSNAHTDSTLQQVGELVLSFHAKGTELLANPEAPLQASLMATQKVHSLKKLTYYGRQFGPPANYSANVLEELHKKAAKEPFRSTMGIGQEQQIVNYVTRHHTMLSQSKIMDLLYTEDDGDTGRPPVEVHTLRGAVAMPY